MEKYLSFLRRGGAAQAAVIDPKTIVTAPWVAFKCQYGCPYCGKNLCCPPHAPAWRETQAMIDCFDTAILFCCPAMETVASTCSPPPGPTAWLWKRWPTRPSRRTASAFFWWNDENALKQAANMV